MKKEGLLFVLIVVLIFLAVSGLVYFLFFRTAEAESVNSCVSLGCADNEIFVGSINSDKYYGCGWSTVKRINEENIVCFSSAEEARKLGYTEGNC